MTPTGTLGSHAENLAHKYLLKQGLRSVTRNYHCRFGEIDLIMNDAEYLVFVEVRYRSSDAFGGALHSIDGRKQTRLRRAAQSYLMQYKMNDHPCRFDILCLDGRADQPEIVWIKNAF